MKNFLRFCFVGTIGFLIDAGFLHYLNGILDINPYTARLASFLLACLFTWLANRYYSFNSRRKLSASEFYGYAALMTLGGAINYITFAILINFSIININQLILGVAAGSVLGMLVNYQTTKWWLTKN